MQNKIDRNSKLEAKRKKYQPLASNIMEKVRNGTATNEEIDEFLNKLETVGLRGNLTREILLVRKNNEDYPMIDGELTDDQRESRVSIGTKGYYRMYRWECNDCGENGRKMPYSEMQTSAIEHYEKTGHKNMEERGGVFERKELYEY